MKAVIGRVQRGILVGAAIVWIGIACVLVPRMTLAQTVDIERRIASLEDLKADRRLAVLEDQMGTMNSIGKGILILVTAHLVLSGLDIMKRRSSGGRS